MLIESDRNCIDFPKWAYWGYINKWRQTNLGFLWISVSNRDKTRQLSIQRRLQQLEQLQRDPSKKGGVPIGN